MPAAAAPTGQLTWAVHVSLAPTWFDRAETLDFLNGVGPRVDKSGLGLVAGHAYSAPYEDIRIKP